MVPYLSLYWGGALVYHLVSWSVAHGIMPWFLVPVLPLLVIACVSRREVGVWVPVALVLLFGLAANPNAFAVTGFAALLPLVLKGARMPRAAGTRMFTGALLLLSYAMCGAMWDAGYFPAAGWGHLALSTASLAGLAWWRSSYLPLVAAVAQILAQRVATGDISPPTNTLQAGVALLVVGFAALIAGVWISLRLRRES